MGASLILVVPAEEESLDTVESYLRHKRTVEREFGEEPVTGDISDHPQYRVANEHLPETFILSERVLSWVFEAMDTHEFYSVLKTDGETQPIYGEEIESLVRILRDAEKVWILPTNSPVESSNSKERWSGCVGSLYDTDTVSNSVNDAHC